MTSPQRRAAEAALAAQHGPAWTKAYPAEYCESLLTEVESALAPFFAAPPAEVAEVADLAHEIVDLVVFAVRSDDSVDREEASPYRTPEVVLVEVEIRHLLARAAAATPAREVELLAALVRMASARGGINIDMWHDHTKLSWTEMDERGYDIHKEAEREGPPNEATLAAALAAAAGGRA